MAGTISENSTCPVLTICSPDLRPFSVIGTSLFSPARQCTELQWEIITGSVSPVLSRKCVRKIGPNHCSLRPRVLAYCSRYGNL
eukprot:COSAG03_NODE_1920_length_3353_cov_7.316226_4_plen_84_part_00